MSDQRSELRRRFLKPEEAADYLNVTTRTIRAMVADGRLRGYRRVRKGSGTRIVRFDVADLDSVLTPTSSDEVGA